MVNTKHVTRRLLKPANMMLPALILFGKFRASPKNLELQVVANNAPGNSHLNMESHTEVKVPIRLTTRDPTIELTEDAGVMLVQTCKFPCGKPSNPPLSLYT